MHAPVIFTSVRAETLAVRTESAPFSKLAQAGIGRTRMHRRTQISADEPHYGDLVCLKSLHLHQAACAFGSVKANGDVELDRRSAVDGALVSTKNIHISSECFVKGPLIAERAIFIDSGVQVGLPDSPTTISAPRIQLAPGSVLHGTIWARVEGRVGG
jgi:hypothetical protein